jgi:hypothetical protein
MAFWINTNEDNFPGAYLDMVRHRKASLHGGDVAFRGQINTQMTGSLIFLYHNKVGIIASGIGGTIFDGFYAGNSDFEERCIMLEDFIHCVNLNTGMFANPISPSDITNVFGHALFRGAIMPLSANIATMIRQECLARGFL